MSSINHQQVVRGFTVLPGPKRAFGGVRNNVRRRERLNIYSHYDDFEQYLEVDFSVL